MEGFVDEKDFAGQAALRRERITVLKWGEFDTENIYHIDSIEETKSQYPGKLSGILHCTNKHGTTRKVFAPHALLEEIQNNKGKRCYFRSLGSVQRDKGYTHEFDFVAY